MSARTLLFDVKTEFVELMQANTNLGNVKVDYGHPNLPELGEQEIWIAETKGWSQDWANIGALQVKESFTLAVYILVRNSGDDAAVSEDSAGQIFEYVQQAVADQANFTDLRNGSTGKQLTSIIVSPAALEPMQSTQGRVTQISLELKVTGRI